jgi:flagellar biosynthesis protein
MSTTPRTPLAIALKYDAPDAPRVVAKGSGAVAERIVETARAAGVAVEENAGLAAALAKIDLDQEIPPALYRAVAEVIGFVMRTAARSGATASSPERPSGPSVAGAGSEAG